MRRWPKIRRKNETRRERERDIKTEVKEGQIEEVTIQRENEKGTEKMNDRQRRGKIRLESQSDREQGERV